jgi:hypothetical protein
VWASLTSVASYPLTSAPWSVERMQASVCAPTTTSRPTPSPEQDALEAGVLEGVFIALLDQGLGVARGQLRDDLPLVAPPRELLVGVLDPDDGDLLPPGLLDEAADVRDDRVSLVRALEGAVLHVDDEDRGVRSVIECGHGPPDHAGSCEPQRYPARLRRFAR